MTNHLLNTYNKLDIQFDRGEGSWLFDSKGQKYLDAYCGFAVTCLGHNHPVIAKAIVDQAAKIIHASNLVQVPQQNELADLLIKLSGMQGQVFFNNSGAEAVETALKLARLYGHSKNIDNPKVLVMEKSFHGRTIATIFAGASAKAQAGFGPPVDGFVRVKYNDINAIKQALKAEPEIVAVLLEPIQGEGGIQVPAADYLTQLRAICDEHKILLLLDEIQTGMGRTGKFFCFEHNNIIPDAIIMAKGLANGVPIGACLIRAPFCELFTPGSHGSTFGGNPLACAASIATVQQIIQHKLYNNAAQQGQKIISGLKAKLAGSSQVVETRGLGLMIGVQLSRECADILPLALKKRIIFNTTSLHTIRLLPSLLINDAQVQQIIDLLPELIEEFGQLQV